MECRCDKNDSEGPGTGLWLNSSSVQMGAFTVVGYLLYRFSQTLPAIIRWPIRLFCSLTGLSALWSWVGRLVGTIRVIQTLVKWLSRIWRFFVGIYSKSKWLALTGSSRDGALKSTSSSPSKPGLRLILLGPAGGGRTSLADILLGNSEHVGPLMESTRRSGVMDGREIIVIDTPDLLGLSLGNSKRALEALRSLQLTRPGPHAFLVVVRAPGSSTGINHDVAREIRATLELFGDEAEGYIVPVLTCAERVGRRSTMDQLLEEDAGGLKKVLSLCEQRPELVDIGPDCPMEVRSIMRRRLVERVTEVRALREHFVHELQRREEELLADMASALTSKLGR